MLGMLKIHAGDTSQQRRTAKVSGRNLFYPGFSHRERLHDVVDGPDLDEVVHSLLTGANVYFVVRVPYKNGPRVIRAGVRIDIVRRRMEHGNWDIGGIMYFPEEPDTSVPVAPVTLDMEGEYSTQTHLGTFHF